MVEACNDGFIFHFIVCLYPDHSGKVTYVISLVCGLLYEYKDTTSTSHLCVHHTSDYIHTLLLLLFLLDPKTISTLWCNLKHAHGIVLLKILILK